jgi:hypothetical protein
MTTGKGTSDHGEDTDGKEEDEEEEESGEPGVVA